MFLLLSYDPQFFIKLGSIYTRSFSMPDMCSYWSLKIQSCKFITNCASNLWSIFFFCYLIVPYIIFFLSECSHCAWQISSCDALFRFHSSCGSPSSLGISFRKQGRRPLFKNTRQNTWDFYAEIGICVWSAWRSRKFRSHMQASWLHLSNWRRRT